jgi:hypothetical protein
VLVISEKSVALAQQSNRGTWHWQGAAAAALIVIGLLRITSTYRVFSQTWDEPAHLAAGMEWIDRGAYRYEPLHPPLARALIAAGPYLDGIRSARYSDIWIEGNALLHTRGAYDRNLAFARLGVLPFFVAAAAVVFLWARRLFGGGAALAAMLLLTTLPPVLAHAGIATTDLAVAAGVALAAYTGSRWLDARTAAHSVVLGVAIALAILAKFSSLLFLPAVALAIAVSRRMLRRREPSVAAPAGNGTRRLRLVYLSALIVIWAGYRFSVGPLVPAATVMTAAVPGERTVDRALDAVGGASVYPMPELFKGIGQLAAKNRAGHKGYLLGEVSQTGWWYFFPVAIAVKTPLAFLILTGIGAVAIVRSGMPRAGLEPLLIAVALLLVCLPSRINIGVRHILAIYPFLSIVAGYGAAVLWRSGRPAGAILAAALIGWHGVSSARAHPDYLAYFNELAGAQPERILVDSDLDNGQDLKRLADTLRARGISDVALAYAGSATVRAHGLPHVRWLVPHQPTTGWIAASMYSLKLGSLDRPSYDDFRWLESYEPVATVGRSIRLYYIPERPTPPRPNPPASAGASVGSDDVLRSGHR